MRFPWTFIVCLTLSACVLGGRWEEEIKSLAEIKGSLEVQLAKKSATVGDQFKFYAGLLAALPKSIVSVVTCQQAKELSADDLKNCDIMRKAIVDILRKLEVVDKAAQMDLKDINWNTIDPLIGKLFTVIFSVEEQMIVFLEAPQDVAVLFHEMFKSSYLNNLNQPFLRIKSLVLERSSPIKMTMMQKAMEMKKNDMRELNVFASYVMRFLLRTFLQECAFMAIDGKKSAVDQMINDWRTVAKDVAERGREADAEIWDSWAHQSYLDIDKLGASLGGSLNHRQFASRIHFELQAKYPNRQWFVLVHGYTKDNEKDRYYLNCHDYVKQFGNRKVVVNSVDAALKEPKVSLRAILAPIADYEDGFKPKEQIAKKLFKRFILPECGKMRFAGAIEAKAGPEVKAPENHMLIRMVAIKRWFHDPKPYYLIAFA